MKPETVTIKLTKPQLFALWHLTNVNEPMLDAWYREYMKMVSYRHVPTVSNINSVNPWPLLDQAGGSKGWDPRTQDAFSTARLMKSSGYSLEVLQDGSVRFCSAQGGAQSLSYSRVQTLLDGYGKTKSMGTRTLRIGDKLKNVTDNQTYLICRVSDGQASLINILNGNRWADPVSYETPITIHTFVSGEEALDDWVFEDGTSLRGNGEWRDAEFGSCYCDPKTVRIGCTTIPTEVFEDLVAQYKRL